MKLYKPNSLTYIVIILISMGIAGCSFCFDAECRWVAILTGVGSGGVTSAIVAWLIDCSDCKKRNFRNATHIETLFAQFDLSILHELKMVLDTCAAHGHIIDQTKEYSCEEILTALKSVDGKLPIWDMIYSNIGATVHSLDASLVLTYDPLPQHSQMYSLLKSIQDNHAMYNSITQTVVVQSDDEGTLAYYLLQNDIEWLKQLYIIRGMPIKVKYNSPK
jgi:hypothetical protein